MEVERSSSRPSDPASGRGGPPPMSRSRDGQGRLERRGQGQRSIGRKTATLRRNPRWTISSVG